MKGNKSKANESDETKCAANQVLDPQKHWRSFEYLSLEVLSFMLKRREEPYKLIDKEVTQETRDYGVDGYIRFQVSGGCREYTVEAKLRANQKIALRDIATSVLYFLINLSDRHFIVTNVVFTAEALRVIKELQQHTGSSMETIDGYELRRLLNEGLRCNQEGVPELIELLKSQPLPPRESPVPSQTVHYHILSENYKVASRTHLCNQITSQLVSGEKLFLIEGEPGTGKSQLMWDVAKQAEQHHFEICRLDMSKLYSPRIFILNILHLVLGLNLNDLLDQFDISDKEKLGSDQMFMQCTGGGDYGRAIRYLLTITDDQEENSNYLLRCLLAELSARYFHQKKGLLIIERMADSHWKMAKYLLYVLDILAGKRSGLSVLIEIPVFHNRGEAGSIPMNDWIELTHSLRRTNIDGQLPHRIALGNYTELEAMDILEKGIQLPIFSVYYENAILAKVGTNPGSLFSAISLINAQQLFTLYDVERLPALGNMSIQSAYIEVLLEDETAGSFLHLALAVLCDLDGSLPLSLNRQLEQEYSVSPGTLMKTGLVFETLTELNIQNRYTLDLLDHILDAGTRRIARNWLCNNLDRVGLKEPHKTAKQLWLELLLRKPFPIDMLECTLSKLGAVGAQNEIGRLLLEAYRFQKESQHFLCALDYLLRYLDRSELTDKYNTVEYAQFLSEADRLMASLSLSDVQPPRLLTIKLYFLHYWQCKSSYDYDGCIRYTDGILSIETQKMEPDEFRSLEKYFIQAHIFQALNFKECGNRRACVRAYRNALHCYPQAVELRISCYMNIAAFFYHSVPWVAKRFLDQALAEVEALEGGERNRWLWTYNDRLLCELFAGQGNLSKIEKAREKADRYYSLSNLARTFNFEGCVYFDRGELAQAAKLFAKASGIGVTEGGNKPSFLFLTNVIAVKLLSGEEVEMELNQALDWLLNHFETIVKKIARNTMRKTDHLFAAVVSWIYSVRMANRPDIESRFQRRWDDANSGVPYSIFEMSNVHRDFLRRDTIIVLF